LIGGTHHAVPTAKASDAGRRQQTRPDSTPSSILVGRRCSKDRKHKRIRPTISDCRGSVGDAVKPAGMRRG
jgi:hypothetical protein